MHETIPDGYRNVNTFLNICCNTELVFNQGMLTCEEIRRNNLEKLIERFGTIVALSEATNVPAGFISHIRNKTKDMGAITARRMEAELNLERGWMDHESELSAPAREVAIAVDSLALSSVMQQKVAVYLIAQIEKLPQFLLSDAPERADPLERAEREARELAAQRRHRTQSHQRAPRTRESK